jgi:hypothetical protein
MPYLSFIINNPCWPSSISCRKVKIANQNTGVMSTPNAGGTNPRTLCNKPSVGIIAALIHHDDVLLLLISAGYQLITTRASMASDMRFKNGSRNKMAGCTHGSVSTAAAAIIIMLLFAMLLLMESIIDGVVVVSASAIMMCIISKEPVWSFSIGKRCNCVADVRLLLLYLLLMGVVVVVLNCCATNAYVVCSSNSSGSSSSMAVSCRRKGGTDDIIVVGMILGVIRILYGDLLW